MEKHLSLLLAFVALASAQRLNCDKTATVGGNANGAKCVFPFNYQGKQYSECTTVNYGDKLWCAAVPDYDVDPLWGDCICSYVQDNQTPKPPAGAPSPGQCIEETVGGQKCAPKFKYNFQQYTGCTTANNNGRPWCSLTANYDDDRKWGNCASPLKCDTPQTGTGCRENTVFGSECAAKFIYNGVTYTGCTTVDNKGTPWCSLTDNYDRDGLYENCKSPLLCVTSGSAGPGCTETTSFGSSCAPTFIYNGNTYSGCTTVANNGIPWCSLTDNFDRDNEWARCKTPLQCAQGGSTGGGCKEKTKSGYECAPEYTYNGEKYIGCTLKDYSVPWCSLTENYDKDSQYDECETPLKCTSTTS